MGLIFRNHLISQLQVGNYLFNFDAIFVIMTRPLIGIFCFYALTLSLCVQLDILRVRCAHELKEWKLPYLCAQMYYALEIHLILEIYLLKEVQFDNWLYGGYQSFKVTGTLLM